MISRPEYQCYHDSRKWRLFVNFQWIILFHSETFDRCTFLVEPMIVFSSTPRYLTAFLCGIILQFIKFTSGLFLCWMRVDLFSLVFTLHKRLSYILVKRVLRFFIATSIPSSEVVMSVPSANMVLRRWYSCERFLQLHVILQIHVTK